MDEITEAFKLKAKSSVVQLFIAICGTFFALFGLWLFNQNLLMSFTLPLRMILMIVTQWLLFLVPGILMIVSKENLGEIGFRKEKISIKECTLLSLIIAHGLYDAMIVLWISIL